MKRKELLDLLKRVNAALDGELDENAMVHLIMDLNDEIAELEPKPKKGNPNV